MKKILSVLLSFSLVLSNVNQNICLADTATEVDLTDENLINKSKEILKKTKDFISQKGKKALKTTKEVISENSSTIIASTAAVTISAFPTINGVKNFSKIKELLADGAISIGSKFANLTKILFNVKDIFDKTPNTENVEQSNETESSANTPDGTSPVDDDQVNENLGENDVFVNSNGNDLETANETEPATNATIENQTIPETYNETEENTTETVVVQNDDNTNLVNETEPTVNVTNETTTEFDASQGEEDDEVFNEYYDYDNADDLIINGNQQIYSAQPNVVNSIKNAGGAISNKLAYSLGSIATLMISGLGLWCWRLIMRNRDLQRNNQDLEVRNLAMNTQIQQLQVSALNNFASTSTEIFSNIPAIKPAFHELATQTSEIAQKAVEVTQENIIGPLKELGSFFEEKYSQAGERFMNAIYHEVREILFENKKPGNVIEIAAKYNQDTTKESLKKFYNDIQNILNKLSVKH